MTAYSNWNPPETFAIPCAACSGVYPATSDTIYEVNGRYIFACRDECLKRIGLYICIECKDAHAGGDKGCYTEKNQQGWMCLSCMKEKSLIHCTYCGLVHELKDSTVINGAGHCKGCAERYLATCTACSNIFDHCGDGPFTFEEKPYCRCCSDELFYRCRQCGKTDLKSRSEPDAVFTYAPGRCECVRCYNERAERERAAIQGYSHKPRYNFLSAPTDKAEKKLYLGFELEIEIPRCMDRTPFQLEVAKLPYLYMKSDSSIGYGFEIVSHPGTLAFWLQEKEKIDALLTKLSEMGAIADTQGIHVHVTRRGMNNMHKTRFQTFFDALHGENKLHKIARRTSENYAKPKKIASKFIYSINDFKKEKTSARKDSYLSSCLTQNRYAAVNWQNDATVEVRVFKGTLVPRLFYSCLEFCHSSYQFTKPSTADKEATAVSIASLFNGQYWDLYLDFIKNDKRYKNISSLLQTVELMPSERKDKIIPLSPELTLKQKFFISRNPSFTECAFA